MACDFHQSRCHQKIRSERQAAGCSNASINKALSALKQMFVLASETGSYKAPLRRSAERTTGEERVSRTRGISQVASRIARLFAAPVTLAFFTGTRLAEISRLTWQQVDLRDRTLNLNPGEGWRNPCVGAELGKFEQLENAPVVYNGLTSPRFATKRGS